MFRDGAERALVFRVGRERFAVALDDVDEVVDALPIQRLPDTAPEVLGVVAVRGMLVTVYDPRPLLSVEGTVSGALLLFRRGERRIAFAVDDVYDAIAISPDELLPVPSVALGDGRLTGMVRRENDLIAIIASGALFDATTEVNAGERT
jgi:purine-binding chemotaxis protein CheW